MGRKMLKKLRSRKGASLTFALLAFLVCAVISAVLLASASAAAGRLSGLAAADRRYYAVTSAAQLFSDFLSEKKDGVTINNTFTIERSETAKTARTITYTPDLSGGYMAGSWIPLDTTSDDEYKPSYTFRLLKPDPEDPKKMKVVDPGKTLDVFMSEVSMYYLFGASIYTASSNVDLVKTEFGSGHTKAFPKTWDMTLTVGSEAGLTVDVKAELQENGTLEITFSNKPKDDADKDIYSEVLVLRPGLVDNTANPTVKKEVKYTTAPASEGGGAYTETEKTTTTTTRSTTLTWMVSEIKKG